MIPQELPDPVVRLATVVSIAARVEPELLRSARLSLLPDVDVSAEADLWFSEIVASRSTRRMVLLPEIASALRERLAADAPLLHAARAVVAEAHQHAPAVVQLEEEVTYLALAGGDVGEAINTKLMTVLNTIATEHRPGLVEWVARALPRLPELARQTTAAGALQLVSGAAPSLHVQRAVMSDPAVASLIVRTLPTATIYARLVADGVEISRQEMPGAHALELPATMPLLVELTTAGRTEVVEIPGEGAVLREVGELAMIRTIAGDVYSIFEEIRRFQDGDVVEGRVLLPRNDAFLIDIGYRVEGILPLNEAPSHLKSGDVLDVRIARLDDPSGFVLLGSEKTIRAWEEIERAFGSDQTIEGRITNRVKGGLAVDVHGIAAFLPGSLIASRPVRNLEQLIGQTLTFKIVSFDRRRKNVVLSRRAIVEMAEAARKAETLAHLREGELVRGTVKNITDYGAFVDVGGVDALLHITDITWGRVSHPSEYFNVGDEIEAIVIKLDVGAERVMLGYKQKTPDPWTDIAERYPLGMRVKGRVVSLTDYGTFVELEDGVEGLIHVSEMSWTKRVLNPAQVLSVGQEVDVVVIDVNVENRRLSLSLKLLEQNPWDTLADRHPVGSMIEGRVRNLTDFGAFIEFEEGIDGLAHISDMSYGRPIRHASEILEKGQIVKARVIDIDAENQRLSVSIREFLPNEWDSFVRVHTVGDEVVGEISKVTEFGIFVRLADGVEALAHTSEIAPMAGMRLGQRFHKGESIRSRIIRIDPAEKKIALSLRDLKPKA